MYGLGTDGASPLASDKNGLNGLWKEICPFCCHVHCVCHRLALAVKQSSKDNVLVKQVEGVIRETYILVENRPNIKAR